MERRRERDFLPPLVMTLERWNRRLRRSLTKYEAVDSHIRNDPCAYQRLVPVTARTIDDTFVPVVE